MTSNDPGTLFANAMEAINIQFDRQRRSLRSDYEQKLAKITADEQAAIAEAKQNVKAAKERQSSETRAEEKFTAYYQQGLKLGQVETFDSLDRAILAALDYGCVDRPTKPFPNEPTYLYGPGDGTTSVMIRRHRKEAKP